MRVIEIRASGAVSEETWDEKDFHRWRLGADDGLIRTATGLDFGVDLWAPADQENQPGFNQLGAEIAERLARPGQARRLEAPRSGDMLVVGSERAGLSTGHSRFVLDQVEDIYSPLIAGATSGQSRQPSVA